MAGNAPLDFHGLCIYLVPKYMRKWKTRLMDPIHARFVAITTNLVCVCVSLLSGHDHLSCGLKQPVAHFHTFTHAHTHTHTHTHTQRGHVPSRAHSCLFLALLSQFSTISPCLTHIPKTDRATGLWGLEPIVHTAYFSFLNRFKAMIKDQDETVITQLKSHLKQL